MRFLLAGASGFLGSALRVRLAEEGHEVVRLVRRTPATAAEECDGALKPPAVLPKQ